MEYPIIDLITNAYINNGWTGLDISTGKNLFDESVWGQLNNSIQAWGTNVQEYAQNLNLLPIGMYTISFKIKINESLGDTGTYGIIIRRVTQNGRVDINIRQTQQSIESDILYLSHTFELEAVDIGTFTNFYLYSGRAPAIDTDYCSFYDFQVEDGTEATPYEPYGTRKNDFPNRLKLPLLHYFPHPVIDALQRAAAGTQTADDTEILQYYLTPLGIGGI